MPELTDSKTEKVAAIIKKIHQPKINKLLVVGCGSGIEAAILAQRLDTKVVGIDLKPDFDERALRFAELRAGDATNLVFEDESFDFVFSYHALEHIENPTRALTEIHRVLKTKGGFWIGTPNKSRIIGYVGGKNTSFTEKIRWNIMDWKARLKGEFTNELGAHAGFTAKELRRLLADVFPTVNEITQTYFFTIYSNHKSIIKLIAQSGFSQFIYPSIYFIGQK